MLDEPTNDLDAETLELLEEKLVEYSGTVLMVSHDRAFLNNVVTSTLVFEEDGLREYVGGFDDWQRQSAQRRSTSESTADSSKKKTVLPQKAQAESKPDKPRKLKFKEKQELEKLPGQIEELEADIAKSHELMAQPEFYQKPGPEIASAQSELKKLEDQLAVAYSRWEELEEIGS